MRSRQASNYGTETETEPFPLIEDASPRTNNTASSSHIENRPAASSSLSGRLSRVSASFEVSNPPEGFMAATGTICSSISTRQAVPSPPSNSLIPLQQSPDAGGPSRQSTFPAVSDVVPPEEKNRPSAALASRALTGEPPTAAPFVNGYHFPPKHSAWQSTMSGCIAFWNYFLTPLGFCVTIYGLNVVAWGGMIFLLLWRKWIEWDSQILNALFCVTGFGLAPWRFRDLWFLFQYRMHGKEISLRRLGGIHRGWFRLPGSAELNPQIGPENVSSSPHLDSSIACPYPKDKIPDAPLTGQRAPATPIWKMDAVIWLMVWNTLFQCCLAGFMWGMNRYNRPSWTTGLFVGLACVVAAVGGIIIFIEGKRVKGIEGVPVSDKDIQQLQGDREKGIWHFNNIKDKDLTEDGKKKKVAKK
ncbi:hypothetical protein FOQG_19393 [Fusarium oxysporum f. sp. raphani 54005]|uniref:Uncharacterized protein n=2 Tax=Fusarium oxysporum f. sp. raphani TaxID=96318 RepID=X0BAJ4_FUSOX|nr:hypothetical protein FOQG_19393 [Fusarium oxysporum f. sp. raphani 54005]KAG7423086.1 hypothetical protein Forpi1262_v015557 [Fusarium oxysporum f. sp. raphani]